MTELVYRGTDPVDAVATQALLAGRFSAVWSPPLNRKAVAHAGDRLWLVWQAKKAGSVPVLLGVGTVLETPKGKVFWTNATAPGIVGAATKLGYGGPNNMAFLRLNKPTMMSSRPAVGGLGKVHVGLATATPEQAKALKAVIDE